MRNPPHITIAGAGIGGLTAALTLHSRGLPATVAERAAELRPLGVGLNLLPHAVRELSALGLGPALRDISVAPYSIAFYAARGEFLYREPRGVSGGYGHPQLSVHRGALLTLLLAAVRDRLGADAVRTGTPVTDADPAALGTDILVGADGIHSKVRATLHPASRLHWSGVTMWRGVTRMPAFLDGRTMAIVDGGNGIELVTYPIGPDQINWVLQFRHGRPGALPGDANWNLATDPAPVLERVRGWHLDWLDLDRLITAADPILEYPMVDREPLRHWGSGPVTLLGDAAHPMYPVGANGASQAIVDAAVLAEHLAVQDDPVAALRSYEDARMPVTADVVFANRVMLDAPGERCDQIATRAERYRRTSHADLLRGA